MDDNFKYTVFFDLDGTLTDPYLGISRSIQYALDAFDTPYPEDFRWCIGPPLLDTFTQLLDEGRAEPALAKYRERFADIGWRENSVYDGIETVLQKLTRQGIAIFVATSKPQVYARRILQHFGLAAYFREIYGSELSGERTDKTELIAYALDQQPKVAAACMIGDRRHDIIGAKNNGLHAIGVSYGFGDVAELTAAGADQIVDTPHALGKLRYGDPVLRNG